MRITAGKLKELLVNVPDETRVLLYTPDGWYYLESATFEREDNELILEAEGND